MSIVAEDSCFERAVGLPTVAKLISTPNAAETKRFYALLQRYKRRR